MSGDFSPRPSNVVPLPKGTLTFGPFRFDLRISRLYRDELEIHLPPRAASVLQYLLTHAGRIVSREELLDAVWAGVNISDEGLTQMVSTLRHVLGDDARSPTYIQTVPRHGYRFIGEVSSAPGRMIAPEAATSPTPHPRSRPELRAERPPRLAVVEPERSVTLGAAMFAAAVVALVASLAGWGLTRTRPAWSPGSGPVSSVIETPEGLADDIVGGDLLAISPDGRHLVYVAGNLFDTFLVHRQMHPDERRRIPGSEGARHPFFSPRSDWIGFSKRGDMYKAPVAGGAVVKICRGCVHPGWGAAATWSSTDDTIIVAKGGSLWRVSAAGGDVAVAIKPQGDYDSYRRPEFLPDGRTVLLDMRGGSGRDVGLLDPETGRVRPLVRDGKDPSYASSGHIVFARRDSLYAVRFDSRRHEVSGLPMPVREGVRNIGSGGPGGAAQYSLSPDGLLVYVEGTVDRSLLVWVDRTGEPTPLWGRSLPYVSPRLSPDGGRVAVGIEDKIGIYDIRTGTMDLLSLGDELARDTWSGLVWTPDGEHVVYSAAGDRLASIAADGSGEAKLLLDHGYDPLAASFSTSGDLTFHESRPAEKMNILVLSPAGPPPQYLVHTPGEEWLPTVSPDGRYFAYVSSRPGPDELYADDIYVEPFVPGGGPRAKVSEGGGTEPHWAPAGDELFYRSIFEDAAPMIAVPVTTDPKFQITGKPRTLFEADTYGYAVRGYFLNYDVDLDGERFLMVQTRFPELGPGLDTRRGVTIISNWFAELERLASDPGARR